MGYNRGIRIMAKNEIKLNDNTMLSNWCDCSMFQHSQCFELKMRYEDVKMCCHSGSCDDDCEIMRNTEYIRKQLDEISNEQMFGYVSEYICDEDITNKLQDRQWLELYTIWLSAGDLMDEISMGYLEYRLCDDDAA